MMYVASGSANSMLTQIDAVCKEYVAAQSALDQTEDETFPLALYKGLAAAGALGYRLPVVLGGSDGSLAGAAALAERLGRHGGPAMSLYFVNCVCLEILMRAGVPAQRDLLPSLAKGDLRLAFALTEPEAGSDASSISLTAELVGDEFVINGTKLWATGSWDADFILTVARTNPNVRASKGSSVLLVPGAVSGLSKRRLGKVAGNAHASCELEFDNVRVPRSSTVGEEGDAWTLMRHGITFERIVIAAWLAGIARVTVDELIRFVNGRSQFGQTVGRFQSVQHQIANLATTAEAMWLMAIEGARRADQGDPLAPRYVNMAKVYCSEQVNGILNTAIRLTGGTAHLASHPLNTRLRESMLGFYAGGTAEIGRNAIARSLGVGQHH